VVEKAGELAAAIVSAVSELYGVSGGNKLEQLCAEPAVRELLPEALRYDEEARVLLFKRLAIHLARECLHMWTDIHPDDRVLEQAVAAAEAWAACPCRDHAREAAELQPAAVHSGLRAWNRPPKTAAWAARTAAWAAHVPIGGWQALTAIEGACRATSSEYVIGAAAAWLARF
jgi:hypothetical protein